MLLKQNEWQLYTDGTVAEEATTPLFFCSYGITPNIE